MPNEHYQPLAFPEAERQSAELLALRRMLGASQGTFSLSIAVCNSPALRDYLVQKFMKDDTGIAQVNIPANTADVLGRVAGQLVARDSSGLFLLNLEQSVSSTAEAHPVLRALNASREIWKKSFSCPVVFWVPEYVSTLMSTCARDFWAWRSHQFEFVSELAHIGAADMDGDAGDVWGALNLDADQKRFRIAELEQRIEEAGQRPPKELREHVAVWCYEESYLKDALGDRDGAESAIRAAISLLDSKPRIHRGLAIARVQLGMIALGRGQLDDAAKAFRTALRISEAHNMHETIAIVHNNLGIVYVREGNIAKARRSFNQAIALDSKHDRTHGLARSYGNLANLFLREGDYSQAEKLIRESIKLFGQLGHRAGIAGGYGNLGLIYKQRGDLDKAEELFHAALSMKEELGDLDGTANDHENIGDTLFAKGDLDGGARHYQHALEAYEALDNTKALFATRLALSNAYFERGDRNKAKNTLLELLATEQKKDGEDVSEPKGVAYYRLGLISLAAQELSQAVHYLQKALDVTEASGDQHGNAHGYRALGGVHRAAGRVDQARENWARARSLFLELESKHDVEQLDTWLADLEDSGSPSRRGSGS